MIVVKISTRGMKLIGETIKGMDKQWRFATSVALNRTAYGARTDVRRDMSWIFDRPTKFTLNSLRVERSKKTDVPMVSEVYINDEGFKSRPALEWLSPHIYGGARKEKRSEWVMKKRKKLKKNEWIVPGRGARLSPKTGNFPRAQMVKILSNIRSTYTGDYDTPYGDKVTYYVDRKGKNPGVYRKRYGKPELWLKFITKAPQYTPIFPFHKMVEAYVDKHYLDELDDAMDYATRTAR